MSGKGLINSTSSLDGLKERLTSEYAERYQGTDNSVQGLDPEWANRPLFAPTHRPEEAAIVAEICARLLEWRSLHTLESAPFNWIQRIASLGLDHPDSLWLYLHLQSGDLSSLTMTYQEQALERGLDRQSIHERHQSALLTMSLHFPELQQVITSLHHIFKPSRGINHTKDSTGPS